jgi:diamine N-acetyltransferase
LHCLDTAFIYGTALPFLAFRRHRQYDCDTTPSAISKGENVTTLTQPGARLRPLEREDLRFVHQLDNDSHIMRYWFEEPYEAYVELAQLYDRHVHDQSERRFILESDAGELAGLVELVEINHIHRRAEFQIIVAPAMQGKGYAGLATRLAIEYAFRVLNLYKLCLYVDTANVKAIHIYEKCGFVKECELKSEFFVNGEYRDALRMCMFQPEYLAASRQ